jgi:hypothetical protein
MTRLAAQESLPLIEQPSRESIRKELLTKIDLLTDVFAYEQLNLMSKNASLPAVLTQEDIKPFLDKIALQISWVLKAQQLLKKTLSIPALTSAAVAGSFLTSSLFFSFDKSPTKKGINGTNLQRVLSSLAKEGGYTIKPITNKPKTLLLKQKKKTPQWVLVFMVGTGISLLGVSALLFHKAFSKNKIFMTYEALNKLYNALPSTPS